MSGKYIPPSLRNRNRFVIDEPKQKVPTADDFPSLGGTSVTKHKASFQPVRSFAVLATEWNEHAEDEKIRKEAREAMEHREAEKRAIESRNVFVYHKNDHYYDDQYEHEYNEQVEVGSDGWTTVQKKAQKDLTAEELLEKKLRLEEEERRLAEDSVWNDSTGDDWDYRDRRAYS